MRIFLTPTTASVRTMYTQGKRIAPRKNSLSISGSERSTWPRLIRKGQRFGSLSTLPRTPLPPSSNLRSGFGYLGGYGAPVLRDTRKLALIRRSPGVLSARADQISEQIGCD